jgi:hypothetical protein
MKKTDYKGDKTIGNMTLDEAALNDAEMFKDTIKNAKRYTFTDPKVAIKFVGACIGGTLEYVGIPASYNIPPKMLDRIQKTKGIVIEHRTNHSGDDIWKNGIYIFKKDLLVVFVSDIFAPKEFAVMTPIMTQWVVFTNARVK